MSSNFVINYAAISNMGLVRDKNEDNLFVNGEFMEGEILNSPFVYAGQAKAESSVFSVCDGMGGEAFGEEASLIAVKTLKKDWQKYFQININIIPILMDSINEINKKICQRITLKNKRMGTTLALVAFIQNKISIFNIGDSRIYQYRNKILRQISVDHTQVQTLIRSGIVSPEQAITHPSRNKLTQHLGIFSEELIIEPHIMIDMEIQDADQWLICSDGLTDMLNDTEISEIFNNYQTVMEQCNKLTETALQKGGKDNVTVIVLKAGKQEFADAYIKKPFDTARDGIFSKSQPKLIIALLAIIVTISVFTVSLIYYILKNPGEKQINDNSQVSSNSTMISKAVSKSSSSKTNSNSIISKPVSDIGKNNSKEPGGSYSSKSIINSTTSLSLSNASSYSSIPISSSVISNLSSDVIPEISPTITP